jgi:hypothetical protein
MNQFKHKVDRSLPLAVVVYAWDRRVGQRRQQCRLALEVRQPDLAQAVVVSEVEHFLDGAEPFDSRESEVPSAADSAHATDAGHIEDAIAPLKDGPSPEEPGMTGRGRTMRRVVVSARLHQRRFRLSAGNRHGTPFEALRLRLDHTSCGRVRPPDASILGASAPIDRASTCLLPQLGL